MEELPTELLVETLCRVHPADLLALHLVCRSWRIFMRGIDESELRLWRMCYFNTWPPPLAPPSSTPTASCDAKINWKKICLQRMALSRHGDPQERLAEVGVLFQDGVLLTQCLKERIVKKSSVPKLGRGRNHKLANQGHLETMLDAVQEIKDIFKFVKRSSQLRESLEAHCDESEVLNFLEQNLFYESFEEKKESDGDSIKGSVVIFSPVSGLPLRVKLESKGLNKNKVHSVLQWQALEGEEVTGHVLSKHAEKTNTSLANTPAQQRVAQLHKLQTFLLGDSEIKTSDLDTAALDTFFNRVFTTSSRRAKLLHLDWTPLATNHDGM